MEGETGDTPQDKGDVSKQFPVLVTAGKLNSGTDREPDDLSHRASGGRKRLGDFLGLVGRDLEEKSGLGD